MIGVSGVGAAHRVREKSYGGASHRTGGTRA